MSYDLMVFEPKEAPRDREDFMAWFQEQTQWSEDHSYEDPSISSPALQNWFSEMMKEFPPMNGPLSSDDGLDNPKVTDHCIGINVIYSAYAWSVAEEANSKMRELARKHKVGFFDLSEGVEEIYYPDDPSSKEKKPWWKFK